MAGYVFENFSGAGWKSRNLEIFDFSLWDGTRKPRRKIRHLNQKGTICRRAVQTPEEMMSAVDSVLLMIIFSVGKQSVFKHHALLVIASGLT